MSEKFVRGNDRLAKALCDPDLRGRVAAIREEMEQADHRERSACGADDIEHEVRSALSKSGDLVARRSRRYSLDEVCTEVGVDAERVRERADQERKRRR